MKIFIGLVFLFQQFLTYGSEVQLPQITDPGTRFAEFTLHNIDTPLGQFYLKTHILTPLFNQKFDQCVVAPKQREAMHEQYAIAYLNAIFVIKDDPFMILLREGAKNGWSPAPLTPFDMINWILSGKNILARSKMLETPILQHILPMQWFFNGLPLSCTLLNQSVEEKNLSALQIILKSSSHAPRMATAPSKDQIAYALERASYNGWGDGVSMLISKIGILDSVMLGHIETAMANAAIQGHVELMSIFMDTIGSTDHAVFILRNTLKAAATYNCVRSVHALLQLNYFKKSKQDLNDIALLTTNKQIADMIRMRSIKPSCFCSFL